MYDLKNNNIPLYLQIAEQTVEMIYKGILKNGDKLPSIRELAIELGVNPSTISKAYNKLDNEGFIRTEAGKGTFINFSLEKINSLKIELKKELLAILDKSYQMGIKKSEIIDYLDEIFK